MLEKAIVMARSTNEAHVDYTMARQSFGGTKQQFEVCRLVRDMVWRMKTTQNLNRDKRKKGRKYEEWDRSFANSEMAGSHVFSLGWKRSCENERSATIMKMVVLFVNSPPSLSLSLPRGDPSLWVTSGRFKGHSGTISLTACLIKIELMIPYNVGSIDPKKSRKKDMTRLYRD